ncbi:MAG: methyltransferase domain-containing protein [Clostridia bacterium]|nr:methyltransferase domain-containing protein [Clostridia bacterium]
MSCFESEIFNKAADYYDRFRPSYPQEIINILINETAITQGSKLLEIGAGSAKATSQFASKGFDILCIEPGEDLVRIGNKRFENDTIEFRLGRFEETDLPKENFDLVFAAQSFHWIPQPAGFKKCHDILKTQGNLAILYNMYLIEDNEQDRELLRLSNKHGGFADFVTVKQIDERIKLISSDVENSQRFTAVKVFKKYWVKEYTADEYYGFVLTGNKILQKSEEEKAKIYEDIKCLADKFGGMITRAYFCVLYLAEKL